MKEIARRDALQAVAGLVSVATAVTVTGRPRSAPPSDSTTALDTVPATADAVVDANVDALRQDDGLRTLTTVALQQRAQYVSADSSAEQPRDVDALLSDIETEFETSPERVHRATVFGDVGGDGDDLFDGYAGVVLRAELSAEDVKSGIENFDDIAFTELDESGTVVYEPESDDSPWVGALGSDRVAVGTEAAVFDAVGVRNGETATVGEPIRGAYTDTREAPVRFATRLPDPSRNDAVPAGVGGNGGQSIDITPLDDVTTLAGSVYRDGDVRGLEATLSAADTGAARDVTSVVRQLRDRAASELQDAEVADVVGDLAVDRDSTTVTASVSRTVDELSSLVEEQ
ncbi:hypothetical protein EGH22_15035 [Halomicroarcula sp. F28]|uniref:hypothetical protein n=1 Tax=Haloarcula salinisoli TaxID=2487746 RepID=UPI001C732FD9|nr:hypothetical protein [Halomicroarcula salinisoli]MBX0287647.1 hypothetical protein [Halomicroarcula salinisoli]